MHHKFRSKHKAFVTHSDGSRRRKDIDALLIATGNRWHAQLSILAMQAVSAWATSTVTD